MKYITYINQFGAEDIRIFSTMIEHKEVALEMGDANKLSENHEIVFLGAGFIEFGFYGKEMCYGHSESMKLNSRGTLDTKILKLFIKMSRRKDQGECHAG